MTERAVLRKLLREMRRDSWRDSRFSINLRLSAHRENERELYVAFLDNDLLGIPGVTFTSGVSPSEVLRTVADALDAAERRAR